MKNLWIALVLILCTTNIFSQYTDIINSNRPSLSKSPFSVGTGVLQFENGFFYEDKTFTHFSDVSSFGTNLSVRYGNFMERLEFVADITYRFDDVKKDVIHIPNNYKSYGISYLTIGAKYLIYQQAYDDKTQEVRSWKRRTAFDWKRFIPSVGAYVGVNTNFVGPDYKDAGISPKVGILLHNEFSPRFILVSNIIGDKLTNKERANYQYIVTATYVLHPDWSIFAENEGNFNNYSDEFFVGIGLGYLVNQHLQLDISYRNSLNVDLKNPTFSAGFSWRLDRHQDSYIDLGSPEEETIEIQREPFFKRIFKKRYKKKEF
ncbi:MAG: transporter [Flavobacteriaceae bacterium]|nr:transporter [Flavobacteriaceae bacterium]